MCLSAELDSTNDKDLTPVSELTDRTIAWAKTMSGYSGKDNLAELVTAHRDSKSKIQAHRQHRIAREAWEREFLAQGATLSSGAGNRIIAEEPDDYRTCFERDRDRIIHSTAFRRLAGKTQVVVFPTDHQRTRLTHALEVNQVAVAIANGIGANVALTSAIALGHDCGHGPGGHASEDALSIFLPDGYEHGPWGADVVLQPLNLCLETLDGIRNHSWSRPAPSTVEGEIVSWADRIAYCAHDLEDAIRAKILSPESLPREIVKVCGIDQREQLNYFITALIDTTLTHGKVGMHPEAAEILAKLRRLNYERIYTRPESVAQANAVIATLRALVEFYLANPKYLPNHGGTDVTLTAVTYVGAMTDRYAFNKAVELLNWPVEKLPQVVG